MSTLTFAFVLLVVTSLVSYAIYGALYVAVDLTTWFPRLCATQKARRVVRLLTGLRDWMNSFVMFIMLITAIVLLFMLWENYSFVFLEHP